jgi:hypothetical protein
MIFNITIRASNSYYNKLAMGGLLCFFIFTLFACKKSQQAANPVKDTTAIVSQPPPVDVNFFTPSYNPSALDTTKSFYQVPVVHNLFRKDLYEISGVAASRINSGVLYIHNDSGNSSQVYLTDANGSDIGTLTLSSVNNRDWEDIAVGPGPDATKSYVYVGEIGDNDSKYNSVYVYRFPEPNLTGITLPFVSTIPAVDVIQLKYPDGPRNAETLMIDPLTKDIYIVSKENTFAKVYVAKYPQSLTSVTTLTPIVKFYFNKATGGDISPDGTEILLRSNELFWYWKLNAGTSISAGLLTKPQHAPYFNNEPQGEGIGFAADGSGYFTDTEIKGYTGKLATMSFYKRY